MNEPQVSVVIPAYGPPTQLERTLTGICAQSLPREAYEVIVVDNNHEARWSSEVQAICHKFPARYAQESQRGAGAARNRGITLARGEVVVFIDDDVETQPDFLARHLDYQRRFGPAVVLGKTELDYPRRDWFGDYLLGRNIVYAFPVAGETPAYNLLYGTNAAVPKAALDQVGGFDPDFIRRQDSELGYRLHLAGVPLVAAPDIVVRAGYVLDFNGFLSRTRVNGYYFALHLHKHPELRESELRWWYRYAAFWWAFAAVGWVLFWIGCALKSFTPRLLWKGISARVAARNLRGYKDFEDKRRTT